MSGFLYNGLASGHDWQDYQVPNNGDIFPSYNWAPEILWELQPRAYNGSAL